MAHQLTHSIRADIVEAIDASGIKFNDADVAVDLIGELLHQKEYSRNFSLRLIAAISDGSSHSWETRRLATLILENQLMKLATANRAEWALMLTQLGLMDPGARSATVHRRVLKEGYSTPALPAFVAELRGRLSRLDRVHSRIRGNRTSRDSLEDFVRLSKRECKLTLARYVFAPEEVVQRILTFVASSKGTPDMYPFEPGYVAEEALHAMTVRLPEYEAAILRSLCDSGRIYWVTDATSSEINSLVEYPITTVVLVIKPPGSDLEFEIKRAGRRGHQPLSVVYARNNGDAVPPSHRLDGGSAQEGLRYEAHSASRLSRVFRLAHTREAPIPPYLSRTSIHNVAAPGGEVNTLNYFSEPPYFGEGFHEMRGAMDEAVAAFAREYGPNLPDFPGTVGRTMQFLSYVTPGQAILADTSSFRLDRLAIYLSDDGAEQYFTSGLKTRYSDPEAKGLADEILEEVLGVYRAPRVAYRRYGQYLTAAFRVMENRARADQNYESALHQVGTFWGTLFAIRGHSMGESFVARNVGLRSVYQKGDWRLRVLFMDHDNLQTNEVTVNEFQAIGIFKSLSADDVFIWGGADEDSNANNDARALKIIYRPSDDVISRGKRAFHDAALQAYRSTHNAIRSQPGLRVMFDDGFLGRVRDWDSVIAQYLKVKDKARGIDVWRKKARGLLERKGYEETLVTAVLLSVETYGDFLAKYEYLFDGA